MQTKSNTKLKKIILFIVAVAAPLLLGFLSSLLAGDIRGTYEAMNKPPLSPPGWLFGAVWPVLYLLMGLASYLALVPKQGPLGNKRQALVLYIAQLVFNFLWSIVFFRADSLWLALVVILILDVLVVLTMRAFNRLSKPAVWLFIPYILWILFATYLNIAFAIVN